MIYIIIISLILFVQYKRSKNLFIVPFLFSLIVYLGYIHSFLLEVIFDKDFVYHNAYFVFDQGYNVVKYATGSIIAFNIGFMCLRQTSSVDYSLEIQHFIQKFSTVFTNLVLFCLFIHIFIFFFDLNGVNNFFLSSYERGTHFGIDQFSRASHPFINIILVLYAFINLAIMVLTIVLSFSSNKKHQIIVNIIIVYQIIMYFYSQSQSIIFPFAILAIKYYRNKKCFHLILSIALGLLFSYIFRIFRTYYNQLGIIISYECILDFMSTDKITDVFFFNPLNCYPPSTFIFENIDSIFHSYSNSLYNFLFIISPLQGTSLNHELGINVLSDYLDLPFGVPTPGIAHIYGGFKQIGLVFFFLIGLISKYILVKTYSFVQMFSLITFIYSFIILDHSNIRAFWRLYSFPIYLYFFLCLLNYKTKRKTLYDDSSDQCNSQ